MSSLKEFAAPLDALDEVAARGEMSIRTKKQLRIDGAYFAGHFLDHPIYPGVFLVEGTLQAARECFAREGGRLGRLVEVVSARFLAPVQPGDLLEVACELTMEDAAGEVNARGICFAGQTKVAQVRLRFLQEVYDAEPS
jgi:3-hydroxymyristoyl/3-hydroxydecanoyl-(acyl carrier protein) dehydratase